MLHREINDKISKYQIIINLRYSFEKVFSARTSNKPHNAIRLRLRCEKVVIIKVAGNQNENEFEFFIDHLLDSFHKLYNYSFSFAYATK